MAKDLGMLNQNVSSISKSMNIFSKLAGFTFLGLGIRQLTDMSDSVQTLKDRLKILTGSAEAAESVFTRLQQAAFRTKTSTAALATIYARMGAATKDLGVNTDQLLKLTEILQNTFRLSGSTAMEATSAAIQLSQGFASGQLRGQELRSVLESNVVMGQILSSTFKVTRGELYKMAEAGQLTADKVFIALLKNGEKLNVEAKNLSQTFDQSLTIAMDKLAVKVADLNKLFGISEGLAKGIDWIAEKSEKLIIVLGSLAVAFGAIKIAKLIAGFETMVAAATALGAKILAAGSAIIAFAMAHPLVALLAVTVGSLIAAFAYFTDEFEEVIDMWEKFRNIIASTVSYIGEFNTKLLEAQGYKRQAKEVRELTAGISDFMQVTTNASRMGKNFTESLNAIPFYTREFQKLENLGWLTKIEDPTKDLSNIKTNNPPDDKKPEKELKKYKTLNDAFNAGKISVDQYAEALRQADIAFAQSKFANGEISLFERNEKQNEAALSRFNQQLSLGIISVQEYNDAVNNLQASELKEKLDAGVISLKEYESTLVSISNKLGNEGAFRVGIRNYLESIGTLSSDIAGAVENAFGTLEDAFFQFTMKGKRDFADMTQLILDDLAKIIIRASILRPLAGGLESIISGWTSSPATVEGGGGGQTPYMAAKGAIVDNPTFMGFTKGRPTIAGEAGPEAVLPLSRGANGNLGVSASVTPVTINVINNAGVGIEQQETVGADGSKTLDLIITNKIKEGISTGSFDRVFSSTYGLKRRGV